VTSSVALVYGTGANTFFGKTAELMQEARATSHFQRAVLKIGNYLILLAVALVAIIITVALFRGDRILTTLQFALVLTVAAIPVAMPTVLSVTMAVGARLLAKKEAIVTRLAAIEELAGVDILCSDKTGTLTQNKLTLGDPFSVNEVPTDQVILCAALASRAEDEDTIDKAVLDGLEKEQNLNDWRVLHFQPFDPVHKRTEATVKGSDGNEFKTTKGAPQVILEMSANASEIKSDVEKAIDEFASRGFRSLGVARTDEQGNWQFLGVLPLFDPPRDEAKETLATARNMGVHVKMVTGDQVAIAKETAKKLGMGTNILDAAGFGNVKHHETAARPYCRHDRRRSKRCPRVEKIRLRHRRLRRNRRGVRGGIHRADDARSVGDHRCNQREPEDFPAYEQLCHLSHRRNAACPAVHDPRHSGLQLLPVDGGDDRHAGAAQRRRHSVDCLRHRAL
jgi:H+-transporting ATPase